jgi:CYTH domain-containing protein
MAIEIERKFWVRSMVFQTLSPMKQYSLKQGYLSDTQDRVVRVRVEGGEKAWLTIKDKTIGWSRNEYEYEIPIGDGLEMLAMCPVIISKDRYVIPNGKLKFEVDVFEGDNEGLVIAEIELPSVRHEFSRPDWLSTEIYASSDMYHRVSNSSLAKFPLNTWDPIQLARVQFPEPYKKATAM